MNRRTALRYFAAALGGVAVGVVAVNWKPSLSAVCEGASPFCRQCKSAEHVGRVLHVGCSGPRRQHLSVDEVIEERKHKAAYEREKPFFVGSPQDIDNVPRWGCHNCGHKWGRQSTHESTTWLTVD